jgi:cytochrome c556
MFRKCLAFALTAGLLFGIGVLVGPSLSQAADDDETPLGKIMEKVNKHNSVIQKGVRKHQTFVKAQKEIEKSAKELVKLAKDAKKIKDAAKKAKDVADPEKKWDAYMDEFIKTCEDLGKVVAKSGAKFEDAKEAFGKVKNACADCHKDFRKDEEGF